VWQDAWFAVIVHLVLLDLADTALYIRLWLASGQLSPESGAAKGPMNPNVSE
jgi:hypothetical protein